jgi:hypothetical protein
MNVFILVVLMPELAMKGTVFGNAKCSRLLLARNPHDEVSSGL